MLLNHRAHAGRAHMPASHPAIDVFSSGGWFDGCVFEVWRDPEPAVVSPARTWLAREGWRRHGLLSPFGTVG